MKTLAASALCLFTLYSLALGQALESLIFSSEELPRAEPLRDLVTTHSIHVRDFGAIPDDGINDWESIQRAFDALVSSPQATLLEFENGRYHLDPPATATRTACFRLLGLEQAVIDGKGADFTILNPAVGFLHLFGSEHVIIRNMRIDYDPLPYTQGWVRAVDLTSGTIDLEVAPGFALPDADYFQSAPERWGSVLDPDVPGRLKRGAHTFYSSTHTTRLAENLFRIQLAQAGGRMRGIEVGDRYQEQARKNGSSIFFMAESKSISYDSITIYAAPAGNFVGSYNEAINVLNCEIAIKSGRWKSSNADAVHLQSNRIGPWIENCRFEGVMDDLVNLYTVPYNVTEMITATELRLGKSSNRGQTTQSFDGRAYQTGDALVFFNPKTGAILAERKILSINGANGSVMLDLPVENIEIGTTKNDTHVYNKNLSGHFVIRGNQFLNSRRYGLLIKASHGLIENNHFEGLFEQAITLHNLPDWPEGLFSDHITIDSNTFKNCGFSGPYLSRLSSIGVVDVWASKLGHQAVAEIKTHRNLRVTNNQWFEWAGNALYIANTDGALITGNKFSSGSSLSDSVSDVVVDAASCENLTIEN